MSLLLTLARGDLLRVVRDRFLAGLLFYVGFVAVIVRFGLPWLEIELRGRLDFDLAPYRPLIVSYGALMLGSLLSGSIGGFLLLETKEEHTLEAVLVSPVPTARFLGIEALLSAVVAFPASLIAALIMGAGAPPWPVLVGACAVAALLAPALALFVVGFASDKVQAFALLKIVGLIPVVAAGMWFVPEPWRWAALILPPYGAFEAWWMGCAGDPRWPGFLLGGAVSSTAAIGLGFHAFLRAARPRGVTHAERSD